MQVMKVLGLAAFGVMLVIAAPTERANALSLSNPGAGAAVQEEVKPETTEAGWRHRHHRWHRHHHHRWHRHHHHRRHHHHHHYRRW